MFFLEFRLIKFSKSLNIRKERIVIFKINFGQEILLGSKAVLNYMKLIILIEVAIL